LHLKKERFDVSISGKLEGIGAQKKNDFTYLNLFQEVRLGAENSLKQGDLIMKVAQGNGVPVDVVGLDDV
jgi:carboxyl-terminal processing protease